MISVGINIVKFEDLLCGVDVKVFLIKFKNIYLFVFLYIV